MKDENKLKSFIEWTRGIDGKFKEFSTVAEVHYFLIGYQKAESDNQIEDGAGSWISDFMIYCEKELTKQVREQKGDENISLGNSYYIHILDQQESNADGLNTFYALYDKFTPDKSEIDIF